MANGFTLVSALVEKSRVSSQKLLGCWFWISLKFVDPHVTARYNGYVVKVGGHHESLIGTLDPPSAAASP